MTRQLSCVEGRSSSAEGVARVVGVSLKRVDEPVRQAEQKAGTVVQPVEVSMDDLGWEPPMGGPIGLDRDGGKGLQSPTTANSVKNPTPVISRLTT